MIVCDRCGAKSTDTGIETVLLTIKVGCTTPVRKGGDLCKVCSRTLNRQFEALLGSFMGELKQEDN